MTRDLLRALLFLLVLILSSTCGSLIFTYLPLIPLGSNPQEIVSPLTILKISPLNNLVRFGLYMLAGICFAAAAFPWWKKYARSQEANPEPARGVWIAAQTLLVALAILQFCVVLSPDARRVDAFWFFHEAEWLAPAVKWRQTGELWTGSFFAHGAFYDALASALSWRIFGEVGLVPSRVITQVLEKINYFPLAALFVATAHFLYASHRRYLAATFTGFSLFCAYFLTLDRWQYLERRDFPALVAFLFFLVGLCTQKRKWIFFSGCALAATWIYAIDRGAYLTASQVATLLALALLYRNGKYSAKALGWLALGATLAFLCVGVLLGFTELAAGFRTTAALFAIKDLSDGNLYPVPGFPITNHKFLSTHHTLPLVCLLTQLIAVFFTLRTKRWRIQISDRANIVQLAFLFISFAYYRGALSRGDSLHYRYVATFAVLGAALVCARAACECSLWQNRKVAYALCLLAALLPLQNGWLEAAATARLLPQAATKWNKFLSLPDSAFLEPWQMETAEFLAKEFKNEKCFASLVSEPLWIYLLQKPHCGKFHLVWLISAKNLQAEAITELKAISPGKILLHTPLSGDEIDGIPIEQRARYLYEYVRSNYHRGNTFRGWEVWYLVSDTKR